MTQLMTIEAEATAHLEEKGSRFIAHLVPYSLFDETLANLRAQHRKASHHVTAFRHMLPDGRIDEGAKDDGEPAGTSGIPTLKKLTGANLVDAGIITVRYFGGTMLGTGGLVRAYSGAAERCITTARLVAWLRIVCRNISCPFHKMSDLEQLITDLGLAVISRDFTATGCTLGVEGPQENVTRLLLSAAPDA